jgi:DNA-binding MarR family transcriptional regulator
MTATSPVTNRTALAQRLRLALARTARRLRQQAGAEISPSQASALASIERHGPVTPSEIAQIERISRPTATRVVTRLAEDGLVERMPDPDDGRSALVSATAAGRGRLASMRRRKDAYLSERFRDLDAADLETLSRAVSILERMLEDEPRP